MYLIDVNRGALFRLRLVAIIFGFVCATSADTVAQCTDRLYPPPSAEVGEPVNLGDLKIQLHTYRKCSYETDVARVLEAARVYVEERASAVKKPALVLDIDETSLSNWTAIDQDDFGFIASGPCGLQPGTACGNDAWQLSAQATPIKPTLDLFNAAKAKGVTVFFITGRRDGQELRAATVENLTKAGYAGWADLYMRTVKPDCDVTCYKSGARADIAAQGFIIIANVGDQKSDLDGGFAEKVFKVPNPFYVIK